MSIITREPARDLTGRIAFFWALPESRRTAGTLFECYPDSAANLILRISSSGFRAALLGPSTERVVVTLDGDAEYLGVRFRPGQLPALVDAVPSELADHLVELDRFGGLSIDDWAERLERRPDLASRQALLETSLRRCGSAIRDERVRRAALLLDEQAGQLRIDALADSVGLHRRSLERLFLEHVGVSPKRLSRLARARRVLARLMAGKAVRLADLAYECGYADQAHMIREFRELTGRCPSDPQALLSLRPMRPEADPLVRRCPA